MIRQILLRILFGVSLVFLVLILLGAVGLAFREVGLVIPPEWAWSFLVVAFSICFLAMVALRWCNLKPLGSPTRAGWVAVMLSAASLGTIVLVNLNSPEAGKAADSLLHEVHGWALLRPIQRPYLLIATIVVWSIASGLCEVFLSTLSWRYDRRMRKSEESCKAVSR